MLTLHIGFGHEVMVGYIVSFHPVDSAPTKRMIKKKQEADELFDATNGKRVKTVLFMSTGQLVLSALETKTLRERLAKRKDSKT